MVKLKFGLSVVVVIIVNLSLSWLFDALLKFASHTQIYTQQSHDDEMPSFGLSVAASLTVAK